MTMTSLSNRSSAYSKTFKAVSAVDSLGTLKNFKSFRVMHKASKSNADFSCFAVVHKSSTNFNDRVEVFECTHCSSLTLIEPCNCTAIH